MKDLDTQVENPISIIDSTIEEALPAYFEGLNIPEGAMSKLAATLLGYANSIVYKRSEDYSESLACGDFANVATYLLDSFSTHYGLDQALIAKIMIFYEDESSHARVSMYNPVTGNFLYFEPQSRRGTTLLLKSESLKKDPYDAIQDLATIASSHIDKMRQVKEVKFYTDKARYATERINKKGNRLNTFPSTIQLDSKLAEIFG
ncbi:MAG: hypothetical protein ABI721_04285 [Candidatus Dojkabacteria bacterium]